MGSYDIDMTSIGKLQRIGDKIEKHLLESLLISLYLNVIDSFVHVLCFDLEV